MKNLGFAGFVGGSTASDPLASRESAYLATIRNLQAENIALKGGGSGGGYTERQSIKILELIVAGRQISSALAKLERDEPIVELSTAGRTGL